MRDEWQSLLPFYVAGTLTETERQTVEHYLRYSAEGRQALEDWLIIRDAVQAKSHSWSSGLPPLSDTVRAQVQSDAYSQATTPIRTIHFDHAKPPIAFPNMASRLRSAQTRSYRSLPVTLTLVASLLIVFAFTGLLILRSRLNDQGQSEYGASVGTESALVFITPGPRSTRDMDMGILTVETETNTPVEQHEQEVVFSTPDITTLSQSIGCSVENVSNGEVPIYVMPDVTGYVTGTLQSSEKLAVESFSARGWYEVTLTSGDGTGWVRVAQVSLSGDCSQVSEVAPTETPTAAQNSCIVTALTNDTANLYITADRSSTIITQIETVANIRLLARTEDGQWFNVRYDAMETMWVGWINADDVTFDPTCGSDMIETVPMPTPMIRDYSTQIAVTPGALRFVVVGSVETVAPGNSVTLQWFVENTGQVSVEMYGADVQPMDYGSVAPLAVFSNLSPQGELDVTIPSQYDQSSVVFVLVMQDASGSWYDLDSLLHLGVQR